MLARIFFCFAGLLVSISLNPGNSMAQDREATPAVVNPPLSSSLRQTLSLDGDWDFATDPSNVGEQQKWFEPGIPLPNKTSLRVPGCWEAQGVGGPGNSKPFTPERSIRPLGGSYMGAAWYRKEASLPASWARKQIWLKIGGVHAQGWFWVNGTYVGHDARYCGSYKYNITDLVKPGERVVVAAWARNDVPSRKGLMGWIERFGGLYRSVELEATSSVLLDDVWVVGDLDARKATVHIKVRSTAQSRDREGASSTAASAQEPSDASIDILIKTLDGAPAGKASGVVRLATNGIQDAILVTTLDPFRPWSPEEPNLYLAEVVLKQNGNPVDGWIERFGVRKWEVRGSDFYLNNHRFFIRGFGDDHIYPLTLSSPPSRDIHKKHLALAKSYGFAYVRHHTHCEVPEFYDAADEVGIMVQPELPYYGPTPSAGSLEYFDPKKDLEELYIHYRRHVSFATYCTGNEGHLGSPIDREVYQFAKNLDPTRLVLHQDGGANHKDNSDFHQGLHIPWAPGTQDSSWPFDAHEYLNLATDEDPRLAEKYTGAVNAPVSEDSFRKKLSKTGLSWEWAMATLDAGNQLQSIYQKRGLEQARLDPTCGGYIYWTIVDVGSPSAQGLFNQFWETKASTAAFFRQFNSPTVILARFGRSADSLIGAKQIPIFTSGQSMNVQWLASAFGSQAIRGHALFCRLKGKEGGSLSGQLPPVEIIQGEVKPIGDFVFEAPAVTKPAIFKLVAAFEDSSISNSWNLWIFPKMNRNTETGKRITATSSVFAALKQRYPALQELALGAASPSPPLEEGAGESTHSSQPHADSLSAATDLLLTDQLDAQAINAFDAGKNVLLLKLPGIAPGVELGWWTIGPQAGTAIAKHPAFGDFPQDGFLNELWFRLLGHTVSAEDPVFRDVDPLMVGRGSKGYLIHVFQAKAGKGKLLASGLDLLSNNPESVWLLDQFIRYSRSPEFRPEGKFDPRNTLNTRKEK